MNQGFKKCVHVRPESKPSVKAIKALCFLHICSDTVFPVSLRCLGSCFFLSGTVEEQLLLGPPVARLVEELR